MKPDDMRKGQFDSKTWPGIHVEYDAGNTYCIYLPHNERMIASKDVMFIDKGQGIGESGGTVGQ